jgi:acetate kinase
VAKKDSNGAAALAIEMFCYRVRKCIGAYVAALGRVDAVVFGGGIGEHSDLVRAKVCDGLKVLGIEIDPKLNADANGRETQISTKRSAIHVYTIPLDEELYLARAAAQLLGTSPQ